MLLLTAPPPGAGLDACSRGRGFDTRDGATSSRGAPASPVVVSLSNIKNMDGRGEGRESSSLSVRRRRGASSSGLHAASAPPHRHFAPPLLHFSSPRRHFVMPLLPVVRRQRRGWMRSGGDEARIDVGLWSEGKKSSRARFHSSSD